SWSTTFHTYGCKITPTDTIYYLDDVEVFRHPSGEISKTQPHFFLINYAIGGISGWKIDLEREGNASDMYVDYVRVYQGG
ncbi:glycoside hydrolase family 16 protein, partial [bacterium]